MLRKKAVYQGLVFPPGSRAGGRGWEWYPKKTAYFHRNLRKTKFPGIFFALFCNQQRKAPCTLRRDAEMIFLSAGPANRRKGESENGEDQKET